MLRKKMGHGKRQKLETGCQERLSESHPVTIHSFNFSNLKVECKKKKQQYLSQVSLKSIPLVVTGRAFKGPI